MKKIYIFIFAILYFPITLIAQVTTIVNGFNSNFGNRLIIDNDILYYSLDSEIYYFNVNDPNPLPILLIDNINNPSGMEVKDGFLYVARFFTGDIIKLDLSDPNPSPINVTFYGETPNMMEFDGDDLYFTDTNGNRIYKYDNTSGAPPAENFLNTSSGLVGIEVKDNFLYYTLLLPPRILKIALNDPQGTSTEVVSGLNLPLGIEFNGDELYIADRNDNRVVKINVNDNPPILDEIINDISAPEDISLNNDELYIINANALLKINLSLGLTEHDLLDIKFYPNPTEDYLRISNLTSSYEYYLSDNNGRILLQGELSPQYNIIDVSALPSGTYFITIKGDILTTEKFLKQ
jgi:hypothetical protein